MFMKVYTFWIDDAYYSDEYEFTGYFFTTAEALRFIRENEMEGNACTVLNYVSKYVDDLPN